MAWYYVRDGARQGPVEEAEFNRLTAESVIRPETLVWREGMSDWRSLRDAMPASPSPAAVYAPPEPVVTPVAADPVIFHNDVVRNDVVRNDVVRKDVVQPHSETYPEMVAVAAPIPVGAVGGHFCSQCGQSFPSEELVRFGTASICANCKPAYAQRLRETGQVVGTRVYAGFWIRFVAAFIDGLALWIVNFAITSVTGLRVASFGTRPDLGLIMSTMGASFLVSTALSLAYHSFFLVQFGATPGKMAMKLKVITPDGGGISWGRAIGRYFAQWLSGLTLCIGYIMVAFDPEKRALHDYIAGTRVIRTSV